MSRPFSAATSGAFSRKSGRSSGPAPRKRSSGPHAGGERLDGLEAELLVKLHAGAIAARNVHRNHPGSKLSRACDKRTAVQLYEKLGCKNITSFTAGATPRSPPPRRRH